MIIKWLGPVREIPGYGVIETGEQRDIPKNVAESFIYQGLAVAVKSKPKPEESQ